MSNTPNTSERWVDEGRADDARPRWARYLQQQRNQMRLSQQELARLLPASQSAVTDWERGKSKPRTALWRRIATVLTRPFDEVSFELGEGYLANETPNDDIQNLKGRELFGAVYKSLLQEITEMGYLYTAEDIAFETHRIVLRYTVERVMLTDGSHRELKDYIWDTIVIWFNENKRIHTTDGDRDLVRRDESTPETRKAAFKR